MMKYLIICLMVLMGLAACKKDAYLTDDGLHAAEVDLTTYDYLASHPNHMFDTLLMVIDHFGLKEEINNAKTFWVPSDYSVNRYYLTKRAMFTALNGENAEYTFEDLLNEINVDSVRAYIYNDSPQSLNTANTSYSLIDNGTEVSGFAYNRQRQPQGTWSFQDVYYLYYIKIRGEADQTAEDGSPRINRNDPADLRVLCQTTGIITNSGTVLNVLSNQHTFIYDFNELGDTGPYIEDLDDGIRFTYEVSFKPSSAYTGTSVTGSTAWVADAFGIAEDDIAGLLGSSIIFNAIEPDGSLNPTSTANAPGHWFAADGRVVSWGADARLFSEFNVNTFIFSIGQYPDRSVLGDTYTIKQALVYTNRSNERKRAEFVFNVSIK